jgi:hypothetical protein
MAVTVLSRPQGRVLDTTAQTATIVSGVGNIALFQQTSHGLSSGDYIFVDSVYESYNGYWYVTNFGPNEFYVSRYSSGAVQTFVVAATITYYKSVLTHNWSSVHLPIVYIFTNDKWPNASDSIVTVSSISNDAGYVNLNLSGDIKATGSAAELEFVQVFGQNEGIYQIINWISDTDITIDFPYDAGVSFSASTVQYYYQDYHVRVKVYAGLPDSHTWNAKKPYELIGTFRFVPDENGIIIANISDYIKTKIDIDSNNTTLDTLPNDINSFCSFYIEYAEAYTFSSGYTLGTYVSSYTSDKSTFEGYAINAMLPFKTQASGFMSEYVSGLTANTAQKFLTPFVEPQIFDGQYFDISFILNSNSSGFYILEQYVLNEVVTSTVQTTIPDNDIGVYRFQVTYNSLYDKVLVSLYNSANLLLSEIKEIKISKDCSAYYTDLCWKNYLGGHDYWRFNAGKQKSLSTKKTETSTNIFSNWPSSYGKFGETIRKNTSVMGNKAFLIRSQYVTNQQAEDISGIQYSLLVQEVTSQTNKRTVLVDDGSINIVEETDKLVEVSVKIRYTDDLPVQAL